MRPPTDLEALLRVFVIEEAASVLRHKLRNKLGTIRNAAYYLRRKVQGSPLWEDVRIPEFFDLIGGELDAAEKALRSQLSPPPCESEHASVCDVSTIAADLLAASAAPAGIRKLPPVAPAPVWVQAEQRELALALHCLIENALDALTDAGGGVIEIRCAPGADVCAVEVIDDGPPVTTEAIAKWLEPLYTTRPGRAGMGLKIAHRIAHRAGGTLELRVGSERGVRAVLVLGTAHSAR